MVDYDIVVASENSTYLAWQTLLFCSSAIAKLGAFPTVLVATSGEALYAEFEMLEQWGCRLIEHERFAEHRLGHYPPRNELASLKAVSRHLSHRTGRFLFCEADMLFLGKPKRGHELAGQFYSYMNYAEPRHKSVLTAYNLVGRAEFLNAKYSIGVPYTLSYAEVSPLADRWIEVLDTFDDLQWIDIMYSFGIAAASLGHTFTTIHDMCDNWRSSNVVTGSILHYCYGDALWNKRTYTDKSPLFELVPLPVAQADRVISEIAAQLQVAKSFLRESQVSCD